ncbi:MAG TPA: hypothetical protein VI112_02290 [Bacteroidia bacterium]|jgi:hypothetical protein
MKNRVFLILALFTCFAGKASAGEREDGTYEINLAKRDSSVRAYVYNEPRVKKTDPELTYYWYAYNKIIYTQGGYDGRLLHGQYTCFYPNGNLKQKGMFKNGLKVGKWMLWYASGTVAEISNWENGRKEGITKNFDQNGSEVMEASYHKGKLNGKMIRIASGKVIEQKKYKDGVEVIRPMKKKEHEDKPRINKSDSGDKKEPVIPVKRKFFRKKKTPEKKPLKDNQETISGTKKNSK